MIDEDDRLLERLLVLRSQAGDELAFADLIQRYQSRLAYYLRKMLAGIGGADDVMQEVWLDVFRALPRLANTDAFRAWIYSIARGRALKQYRRRRLKFQSLDEELPDDSAPDAAVFREDEVRAVHEALDKLPAVQREVLVLRFLEDLSYEEIAAVVGCHLGTVRSRLYHAKRALRRELEKERNDER